METKFDKLVKEAYLKLNQDTKDAIKAELAKAKEVKKEGDPGVVKNDEPPKTIAEPEKITEPKKTEAEKK